MGRGAWALTLVVALVALGWHHLPTTIGAWDAVIWHGSLMPHLLGLAPRERTVKYGKVPMARRESNGSITEVDGWVTVEEFREKHLWKGPAVFRQAATEKYGFDPNCLTQGGKRSVQEGLEAEMGDNKVLIFKDQYNDASAELMTIHEYRKLAEAAANNKSTVFPYPRAFPQNSMKSCRPMPNDKMFPYRSLAGRLNQQYLPMPDRSLMFVSYNEGTTTKMHMDVADTLFQQVYGRKRWLFVDPEYASELKIWGDTLNLVYIAGYDVHREALPHHIPIREIILHPGDLLYFPAMTFHAVCNLDPITVGIDNPAMDLHGSFVRHWFLTLCTILNPWIVIRSIAMILRDGKWDGAGLYFDGFTKEKQRQQEEEAKRKAAEERGEVYVVVE